MSILFLSSSGKHHETALSIKIGTKSTLNWHQVGELDSGIGTMLKLYRHQVGIRQGLSRDQVAVQLPTQLLTQLDKTTFYKQVTEQVAFSNHKGYQDFAAEVGSRIEPQLAAQGGCGMSAYPDGRARARVTDESLQIHHKPCDVFENSMNQCQLIEEVATHDQ
jgi:hypothetical protein